MAFEPADGILARYYCEDNDGPCFKCAPRGGGMYFFIGTQAPRFIFKMIGTKQRTRTLFTGMGVARELDACSDVPSLEEHLSHQALATNLSRGDEYDKWQRALKLSRVENIGAFWRDDGGTSQICNSIVLANSSRHGAVTGFEFANDEGNEPVEKQIQTYAWYSDSCPGGAGGHVGEEQLSTLLETHGRENTGLDADEKPCDKTYVLEEFQRARAENPDVKLWSDHCPDKDCRFHAQPFNHVEGRYRPFEIVDGQHRTRGVNNVWNAQYENYPQEQFGHCLNGELAHNTDPDSCRDPMECGPDRWEERIRPTRDHLPFTLLPWEDAQAKARVFTDITTRGEDMQPLHKLSMLWRFKLTDGRISHSGWDDVEWNFAENSKHALAYELCLALGRTGANHPQTAGRIPPIITKDQPVLIDIKRLLNEYIIKWMDGGEILDHNTVFADNVNTNIIASKINEYLLAWAYWLSGPLNGPDAPGPHADPPAGTPSGRRIWTPTHPQWTNAGGAPQHSVLIEAADPANQDYRAGHKTPQTDGGFFQNPSNRPTRQRIAAGEITMTGPLQVVFDLFPVLVESILRNKYIDNGNDPNGWDSSYVTNVGATVLEITFEEFRDTLEPILKQYPYDREGRIQFGGKQWKKDDWGNSGPRKLFVNKFTKYWGLLE